MKKRGYTIIELVIALAITASLLALTLPRFDAFQNHSALRTQAWLLVSCLQAANATMTTPVAGGSSGIKTAVTINSNSTNATVTCAYTVQDEAGAEISHIAAITAKSIHLCNAKYGDINTQFNTARFTLHAATHGVIDAVMFDTVITSGPNGTQSQGGTGQGQQLTMQFSTNQPTPSSPCTDPVTLLIPVSGSPVEVSS